jgi:hypothetical protein
MKIDQIDSKESENKKTKNSKLNKKIILPKVETFAEHLTGGVREFYLRMEKLLECEEVTVRYENNRVIYFPDTKLKQQPLVFRYTINENGLTVELKLNFISYYADLIEQMPEHIKEVFRLIKHCGYKTCEQGLKCGMRRTWTLDGNHYYLCSYKFYFNPDIPNPDDAEYYAKIIKAEATAAKARKKHLTTIYLS